MILTLVFLCIKTIFIRNNIFSSSRFGYFPTLEIIVVRFKNVAAFIAKEIHIITRISLPIFAITKRKKERKLAKTF